MQQLLTIETVPISIEYKSSKPEMDATTQSAKLRMTRADKGLTIKSNPIKIRMDSFEPVAYSETGKSNQLSSSKINLSYEATAHYANEGNLQLDIHFLGDPIEGLDFKRIGRSIENVMSSMPSGIADLPSGGRDMRISFDMGGLALNDDATQPSDIKFIPGDIEFKITQYPKIIIKYIGKPLYFPRSADPEYVPPDKLDVVV